MLNTLTKITPQILKEIRGLKALRKTHELFLLFSMGSQFDHLIKQKLDALGVFCLVADPATVTAKDVKKVAPVGIILSGGPASAYELPPFDGKIFDLGIPVLGICLGFQMWAYHIGVPVVPSDKREFGTHRFSLSLSPSGGDVPSKARDREGFKLFDSLPNNFNVLESHGDRIEPDKKMDIIGTTENAPAAAAVYKNLWGVQFHPEVTETEFGTKILENFCFGICKAKDTFPASEVAKRKIEELRSKIGNSDASVGAGKKVLLALSGGTDSSVVAYLLKAALSTHPSPLTPLFSEFTLKALTAPTTKPMF